MRGCYKGTLQFPLTRYSVFLGAFLRRPTAFQSSLRTISHAAFDMARRPPFFLENFYFQCFFPTRRRVYSLFSL